MRIGFFGVCLAWGLRELLGIWFQKEFLMNALVSLFLKVCGSVATVEEQLRGQEMSLSWGGLSEGTASSSNTPEETDDVDNSSLDASYSMRPAPRFGAAASLAPTEDGEDRMQADSSSEASAHPEPSQDGKCVEFSALIHTYIWLFSHSPTSWLHKEESGAVILDSSLSLWPPCVQSIIQSYPLTCRSLSSICFSIPHLSCYLLAGWLHNLYPSWSTLAPHQSFLLGPTRVFFKNHSCHLLLKAFVWLPIAFRDQVQTSSSPANPCVVCSCPPLLPHFTTQIPSCF